MNKSCYKNRVDEWRSALEKLDCLFIREHSSDDERYLWIIALLPDSLVEFTIIDVWDDTSETWSYGFKIHGNEYINYDGERPSVAQQALALKGRL